MNKNRKYSFLKYKKERLVISDVLPFEMPLIVSNRHFYDFLVRNKIEARDGKVRWRTGDQEVEDFVRLVFGGLNGQRSTASIEKQSGRSASFSAFSLGESAFRTIPFSYLVKHREDSFRELTLCHPRNQLELINFFDKNKETLLYYCSKSPFSIRKPIRTSNYRYFKDKTHYDLLSHEDRSVEEYDKEYETLRSFFVYKEYDNVHKFYDSEKFLHCEEKFGKLLKLDITKCFASIYTHSLSWALLGKQAVKKTKQLSKDQFSGRFDSVMQNLNWGETNGIIIGPEFSRIFAELILQAVDVEVCNRMAAEGHLHRQEYEVFRYVDDYFIFYEKEAVREKFVQILRRALNEYKLYLNDGKRIQYSRPIVTELSRAKKRVADILDSALAYSHAANQGSGPPIGKFWLDSQALSVAYKTALVECNVPEENILNWTMAVALNRCRTIFKKHLQSRREHRDERLFARSILSFLRFTFFAYSAVPRVNTTIRLCLILNQVIEYFKRADVRTDDRDVVFQQIYEDIRTILKKQQEPGFVQVESLYLLLALSELGEEFLLDEEILLPFFHVKRIDGEFVVQRPLNYFSIVVLLFYIKKRAKYWRLRACLENSVLEKLKKRGTNLAIDAESVLLLLDLISCPFLSTTTKHELLKQYSIVTKKDRDRLIQYRKFWFTKWTNFDLKYELDLKMGQEVY